MASYLRRLPASLPALRSVSEPPQSEAANKLYVTFFHFVQPMLSYPSRVESKSEPKLLLEASDAIPADSRCDFFEVLRTSAGRKLDGVGAFQRIGTDSLSALSAVLADLVLSTFYLYDQRHEIVENVTVLMTSQAGKKW